MKKSFILGLTVLVLSLGLVLVGCSTDDDGGDSVPSNLIGTWEYTSYYHTLVFSSSGLKAGGGSEMSITSVSGNSITIPAGTFNFAISGNTLTITNSPLDGGAIPNGTYTKQQ